MKVKLGKPVMAQQVHDGHNTAQISM